MTSTPTEDHAASRPAQEGHQGNDSSAKTSASGSSSVYYYDNVTVSLVPEKKGLFLKHSEYEIRCAKQNFCVARRFNDFLTLHSFLICKYPYRLIPRLPPKQIMMDSLLEERRRGLQNFLKIICCHPVLSQVTILRIFLTDNSPEYQDHLRDNYQSELEEFSHLSSDVELPLEDQGRLAVSRENMRRMLNAITKLKRLVDQQMLRTQAESKDMAEMSAILRTANTSDIFPPNSFQHMAEGTQQVSTAAEHFSQMQQKTIGERFLILLEVLNGHSDLCDRVEKGMTEHQRALSKVLNLNRQKVKGVIRGSATADNVNALHEKEVAQSGVAGQLGRRSAFSLYCVLQETTLAQQYLQVVPSILLSFSHEQHLGKKGLATAWSKIIAAESQQLNK